MIQNTAEWIADFFDNDGMVFQVDEANLEEICKKHAVSVDKKDGGGIADGTIRYLFADDSAITVSGDAWDLGFADCFCWQSATDTENCPIHAKAELKILVNFIQDWHGTTREGAYHLARLYLAERKNR